MKKIFIMIVSGVLTLLPIGCTFIDTIQWMSPDPTSIDLKARSMNNKSKSSNVKVNLNRAHPPKMPPLEGTIVNYHMHHSGEIFSDLIRPRPIDVWLPEGYESQPGEYYPVIYMHDGQFLFHQGRSPFAGMDFMFWDVDKVIMQLVRAGEIRPAIVVSIWMADWNKGARGAEYMPQKSVTEEVLETMRQSGPGSSMGGFVGEEGGDIISSDNYLKFLVEELKPFIDETYRTLPDREDTFVMGSSMGGLLSAYALAEYPKVFGGAACLSSHWPAGDGAVVKWLRGNWPEAGRNRVYFDYGTETLDASYEPYQMQMDEILRENGYTEEEDWITRRFEGADHSMRAWRDRLDIPLKFLLGADKKD